MIRYCASCGKYIEFAKQGRVQCTKCRENKEKKWKVNGLLLADYVEAEE